jgi:pyruvate dehydrogenase E2 component (dihydrolipoamide acetyltransferase)
MASAICIPRLGWNMEEGVFLGWLRRAGESVCAGEPLFTLEGEKSAQEVEVLEDGILWIDPDGPQPGAIVPVGAVIGALLRPGESPPNSAPAADRVTPADRPVDRASNASAAPAATPRSRPRSSPLARRIAKELNIDWTTLRGSSSSGRVRKADVLAAAREVASRAATPARSIPIRPARRTIASRMVESRTVTAPVTLTTTVDATNLVNLRGQFRVTETDGRMVPSYTDFLVKLTALTLRDHPLLNARWEGDRIEMAAEAHVGIAVDTEAGLLVPVIRGASGLGLRQIAERARDLIGRARDGLLKAAEMQGGTFTISNLGAYGIEMFTPIINLPECAILGLGRIARQPTMVGDRVEGRERLTLSLTFDHRIVDGAPAARFLQDVGRRVENPGPWLLP